MADEIAPTAEDIGTVANRVQASDDAQSAAGAQPVGYFQRSDEELVDYLLLCFKEAWDANAVVAPKRKLDWQMYAGKQYEDRDIQLAKVAKRPALTFNMLLSIISAVEGEERTNRQEMKFYGEGAEDDPAAYGLNRILKWIMDGCGGEFALSEAFRSMLVIGEGWVVPDIDFFDDPEGKIKLLRVPDVEMFDDPVARSPVSEDSRYCHRVRYMTAEEGEARFPGFRDKVNAWCQAANIQETDGAGYRDIYSTPGNQASLKTYDSKKKLWAVTESWWYQIEPGVVMVDEATNLLVELSPDEFEQKKQQRQQEQQSAIASVMGGQATFAPPPPPEQVEAEAMAGVPVPRLPSIQMPPPLQAKERPIKRFYTAFWCGKALLQKMPSPLKDLKRIPYVPIRGLHDEDQDEFFGLIRPLIDAQRQHNIEQSTITLLTQLMPKQAWMGPKGSFHDKNAWATKIAQPGAMLEYNKSQGKPEPIVSPAIPRHIVDMAFTRPQSMREISGVNIELTGARVASDPGVVMEMRQKAAKTVLAPLFDNNRQSKKALGMVLLAFMQTYISVGRRLRVLGPEGAQYVQMTEAMQLGRYDVTVEETNSTVNDRMATLAVMQTTLPQLAKAGVPVPPSIIDLLPMQPHIRDDWKRLMEWHMAISGQLPPDGWQPGMPVPMPGMPPGMAPPGAPPLAPPGGGAPPPPAQ